MAVVLTHPAMRAMIVELLDREAGCGSTIAVPGPDGLPALLAETPVDLIVVDGADFPACCRDRLAGFPLDHVVVIGAEPDDAYEAAALEQGAGAWLPRDHVGETLAATLHHVLGCTHEPRTSAAD